LRFDDSPSSRSDSFFPNFSRFMEDGAGVTSARVQAGTERRRRNTHVNAASLGCFFSKNREDTTSATEWPRKDTVDHSIAPHVLGGFMVRQTRTPANVATEIHLVAAFAHAHFPFSRFLISRHYFAFLLER
jgi:hypothetical protein